MVVNDKKSNGYPFPLVLLIIVLSSVNLNSQSLTFPYSAKPVIDGIFDSTEWSAADTISIKISQNRKTVIYYMRDSSNLNFAFVGNLSSGGNYFPEIVIDTDNDSAGTFQPDDWWFHVSATDCEYKGAYGIFSNCQLIRHNWKAAPNFATGSIIDTVEISIPDTTLGISFTDTIGIGFLLNNFQNIEEFPVTANHLNPSTWAKATFSGIITGLEQESNHKPVDLDIYPNPTAGLVRLNSSNTKETILSLQLVDISGRVLEDRTLNNGIDDYQFNLTEYRKGLYFLVINTEKGQLVRKIIKH